MPKITHCKGCGKEISYQTKPPQYCAECKTKTTTKHKKGPFKWKKEAHLFHILGELCKNYECIYNGYYSWLVSPKGEPMQLDWYCPELKVAVELQGRQHYEYSNYFHKSKRAFRYLQECDALKVVQCTEHGVKLIIVKYDNTITKEYMLTKLREQIPDIEKVIGLDQ